jgi:hypothetical protein
MGLVIAKMHIECHCVRERHNNIFPVAFWNLELQTTELQGASLPFLVDLALFVCSIEYNEFDCG